MYKLGIAAAASALLVACGTASAADLRVRAPAAPAAAVMAPIYDWTGFYIGIQGGWGGGDANWHIHNGARLGSHSTSGGLIGGTAGINFQTGNFVFGIEGDFAWANISGDRNCGGNWECRSKIESFGTVRGRVGYAWDALLVYGTGGLAMGDVNLREHETVTGDRVSRTHFRTGWTAGGGVEWGFAPGWSAKIEALYFDLGNNDFDGWNNVRRLRVDNTGVIVRGGVNWRFNWGGGAPVYARY